MILLNPGPVNVSERVRQALLRPDICHRESEFSELLGRIQQKLLTAFVPGAEGEYVAVILTGSGTAAVESAVMSCLPIGKRMLVLNNGVYGERISNMIGLHRLGVSELKMDWTTRPDPERLRLALRQHPEVHAVAMVHHETTTGLLNPVKQIAEVVDSQNRVFVVDSVSGLGGEAIDIAGSHIYMVAGTAGKCIQGFPGVSFVLLRKGFLDRMRAYPKRSWYLHLTHYVDDQGRGTIPFTPAVQVYYAFEAALDELLEEGVANRARRYRQVATQIRERMGRLGVKAILPPEFQSNTITAFHLPDGVGYQILHDQLKARGYVIYAGQGQLESKAFRIANMGALNESQIEGFLSAFEQVLAGAAGRS
ncbi:MAG: 2-aminoethylphosphonate--pyruvate transaminase [Nitrospirae bacterium]|nr:MAG: 2-aminoethylphosphonate aminotransferase [Nitrospira sp. OLB3]MBV6471080.1 2-aminoethylphosphonate--pyruvate transaminase [Nitrospirota bacterium]MCK6493610.1 aminotransferase class V-fold PLP-dependent enzyme [Nitrospira sp.]MEB2338984.1 aminotransferase class V-fold PLP-dependent enzyme [Nitrospirales bacterium]QOJ34877.1 MAG: aminotransferase class V-fold PLP-dependent enzyme [Nitrospira sp.]